jgi:hypothetical protein
MLHSIPHSLLQSGTVMRLAVEGYFKNFGPQYFFWRPLTHRLIWAQQPHGREGSLNQPEIVHRGDNGNSLSAQHVD